MTGGELHARHLVLVEPSPTTIAMPRESRVARVDRLNRIIQRLQVTYPDAYCELRHDSPLQLLIATILSAQSTDKQVNLVTTSLFRKYQSAADFARAPIAALEEEIRSLGFFRNKARHIHRCCQSLVDLHGGQVPPSMAALVQLDGVGRKTANVVLGTAFQLNEGVVVDTHVSRLSQRLNLSRQKEPEKIELELMALLPRHLWTLFSHWLIWHGRRRCTARKPDCPRCELFDLCPSAALAPPPPISVGAGPPVGEIQAHSHATPGASPATVED
jgi:endonuclease III